MPKRKQPAPAATQISPKVRKVEHQDFRESSCGTKVKKLDSTDSDRLLWGPYLSERQWGTVREDLSADNNCWRSFSYEDAISRAYHFGEDGLFGFSDDKARLCVSVALWNQKDGVLKERLFGLTGPEGNHGEDVKECYYYLDGSPDHGYMKMLYKYPHKEFPYDELRRVNRERGINSNEYELIDTGVFSSSAYFDVTAEYAKASPTDILCEVTISNRSSIAAPCWCIPTVWFRNTWWDDPGEAKPEIRQDFKKGSVECEHNDLGKYRFSYLNNDAVVATLFMENDTQINMSNIELREKGREGKKDGIHMYIVKGDKTKVNSATVGTKFGVCYNFNIAPLREVVVKFRITKEQPEELLGKLDWGKGFEDIMNRRRKDCNDFYKQLLPSHWSAEQKLVARQAYAGLLWNKQYYGLDINKWIQSRPPGHIPLNATWGHMVNSDVISMPDKWEFPWYATWDLAFHMIPMTDLDPDFVKSQLMTFTSVRYIKENGQLPAYEFNFSDVNPPVHAFAVQHLFQNSPDLNFLKVMFHKLTLNFNWWLNSKQINHSWLFGGGFLGMDNVSCLHRSELPKECTLYQVDGTCWVAFFALSMLQLAIELNLHDDVYEDMVEMFLDYFISLRHALNYGLDGQGLWDSEDGFFYDRIYNSNSNYKNEMPFVKVRCMIGFTALFPVCTISNNVLSKLPSTRKRLESLIKLRKEKSNGIEFTTSGDLCLNMLPMQRLQALLKYLGEENEFLSPFGIRSLSKFHSSQPLTLRINDFDHYVQYSPGESNVGMFGGNSNWRGPIWLPMNYLLVHSLDVWFTQYQNLQIAFPSSSTTSTCTLADVAQNIAERVIGLFLPNQGRRPCHGASDLYAKDPHWKDLVLFYEYFNGDTGQGCGASHQTGWTALVVKLMMKIKKSSSHQEIKKN